MNLFNSISTYFGANPQPGGASTVGSGSSGTGSSFGAFFSNMLSGAARGAEQNAATSPTGQKLFGFLAQGQSQVAAMNLFGNPVILVAVLAGLVLLLWLAVKR